MTPNVRKLALAVHITVSIGWIGAAAVYFVIAAAANSSANPQIWRMAWSVLELVGWYVIVPMAAAALVTGLVMALGTTWGLVRHYWVVVSLLLTIVAGVILVRHMFDVSAVARLASAADATDMVGLRAAFRGELVHAGLGLVLLLGIEVLNVYKPRGLTPFGQGAAEEENTSFVAPSPRQAHRGGQPVWLRVTLGHAIALALLGVIIHLSGGSIRH